MLKSAVVWSVVQRFSSEGLRYGFYFVLALLLDPRDFGLLAIASLWIGFISVFSDLGLSSAVIQRTSIEAGHLSTAFYLNVIVGSVLAVVGVLMSGVLARLFGAPAAQPVIAVLSLGFVLTSVSLTQQALAYRELRLKDLAIRDIAASLCGGTCGLILAHRGLGVWSLVIQSIASSALAALLIWRLSNWRPRFGEVSRPTFLDLWGYGSTMLTFGGFKYITQNIDKLVIGRMTGTPSLGLYVFAYRLVVYPVSLLSNAFGGYQFARYSRIQDDLGVMRSSYFSFYRVTATIVLPCLLFVAAFSPALIPLLFGWKWAPAAPIAQLLTLVALAVMVNSPSGNLMKALGHPKWLLSLSIGTALATVSFLWIGGRWGLMGSIAGLVAVNLATMPITCMMTCRLLRIKVGDFLHPFAPSVVGTLATGSVLWLVLSMTEPLGYFDLALVAILGLAVYALVIYLMDRQLLSLVLAKVTGNEVRWM